MDEPRTIPNTNAIHKYYHCVQCLDAKPTGVSPAEYARLNVGATPFGVQVWCVRHDANVLHIDFEGQQHPANMQYGLRGMEA